MKGRQLILLSDFQSRKYAHQQLQTPEFPVLEYFFASLDSTKTIRTQLQTLTQNFKQAAISKEMRDRDPNSEIPICT